MAQQDEGWPLGLQPLNARIGITRNRDNSGSISFNTLITASPSSSTDSSSDLDTQSTGSFFPDKSTTFGSLIGVSSILELSRKSLRGSKTEVLKSKKGKKSGWSSWLWCLCSRSSSGLDADTQQNGASLAHFLAEERKAANQTRRHQGLPLYGPDDEFLLAQSQSMVQPNSLFVNGSVAPPPGCSLSPTLSQRSETERQSRGSSQNNGFDSLAKLFPWVCGQAHAATG